MAGGHGAVPSGSYRSFGMGSLGCTPSQLLVLLASISRASNGVGGTGDTTTDVSYRFNLAPAPSPFADHQGYYNTSTWSWGGALIHVPDDAHGNYFHSAYMSLRCWLRLALWGHSS
jgi:hypothetical protein